MTLVMPTDDLGDDFGDDLGEAYWTTDDIGDV
jgi:hypothetical protein